MSLVTNASLTFYDYQIQDTGVQLHFVCLAPGGGGEPNDYYIYCSDNEIATVSTLASAKILVTTKLQRKIRATGISTKLDQLIGQSMVI